MKLLRLRGGVLCRSRERERDVDAEDEEEAYERKKLERRLREKEAAYQEVGCYLYCTPPMCC